MISSGIFRSCQYLAIASAMYIFGCSEKSLTESKQQSENRKKEKQQKISNVLKIKAEKFVGPDNLIPVGRISVDIMELMAPRRLQQLTVKFQSAIAKNQRWFQETVRKSKPGVPLPYDSRLGITQAEYSDYLKLATQMGLQKTDVAVLEITEIGENRFRINGGTTLKELSGIEIDLNENSVKTPYGIATVRSEIDNTDEKSATGPWKGVQWKSEKSNLSSSTGSLAKLAFGRLQKPGHGIIYYDVKHITKFEKTVFHKILYFHFSVHQ